MGQIGKDRIHSSLDVTKPATDAISITPSDSTDLSKAVRGIYVGATGNVKVDMIDGSTVTFTALAAGVIHPLAVSRVYATGTTASNIVGVI